MDNFKIESTRDRNIYKTNDSRNVIYQHKPTLYTHYVFPLWLLLSIILGVISVVKGFIPDLDAGHVFMAYFTFIVYFLNIVYFFLVTQGIMYVIVYQLMKNDQIDTEKKLLKKPFPTDWSSLLITKHKQPKVSLIYCTYNDFLPDCLYQCMTKQTYPVDVKILDDSSKDSYKKEINQFAKLHTNVQVIRRVKHKNDKNKAGNLNHGLRAIKNEHYDFYVFLDSDELLEPDFTKNMLKEFYYGDKYGYHVGLIQATHHSGRNINKFMDMNALSAKYFWNTQNVVRSAESGIRAPQTDEHKPFIIYDGDSTCSNLGHGCMADAHALYKSGLFPNVVSEDVASTMNMIIHGYNTYFSTQIHGNEETVTTMNAMKIRCTKFANGDLQWCRKYFNLIRKTDMESKLQKLDTINLMGSTNISGFLYIAVPICSVWYPLTGSVIGTSFIFLIPIIVFLYSNGIIDTLYSLNEMSIFGVIKREFQVMATFSSTYYLTVKATFSQLLFHHQAEFNVTPKGTSKVRFRDAVKDNIGEVIFSLITIIVVLLICGISGWMILLAYVPPIFSPVAELMTNYQTKPEKKLQKIFNKHQKEADSKKVVANDRFWNDWTV